MDKCSAISVVGGDGTINEVINGMMHREDKRKVPLALMPNGSGNDFCRAFKMETVQEGLDAISKGDVVKIDLVKILLDYKDEDELKDAIAKDPTIRVQDHLRYSANNCSLCMSANCARNAQWMKSRLGKHAYAIQTAIELTKRRNEVYDLYIDDGSMIMKDL